MTGPNGPKGRAANAVAMELRNAIIRGELAAGDSLPIEAQLTARFEVSRPTLREAIRILESENLLRVSRGSRGGALVMPSTSDLAARVVGQTLQASKTTLKDIFEARVTIEPPAARMAAERRPKEAALLLRKQVSKEYASIGKPEETARTTSAFYRMILELSGNNTLGLLASILQLIVERHLNLIGKNIIDWEDEDITIERQRAGFDQHTKLVQFIEAGAGASAEEHWRQHVSQSSDFWLRGPLAHATLEVLDDPESVGLRRSGASLSRRP